MKHGLTHSQLAAKTFLSEYIDEHEVSPTYKEIKEALKLTSNSEVHRVVIALEERGHITRLPFRARTLRLVQ